MHSNCLKSILDENIVLLNGVDWTRLADFTERLSSAPAVFFSAQGRSGHILRTFCMRLMHMGIPVHFAGETTTPPIRESDILVVLSGTGETSLTCEIARMARRTGAFIYAILGYEKSALSALSDHRIVIPGGAKHVTGDTTVSSVQPPGSLFEQSAFLLLETVALAIYRGKGGDQAAFLKNHANLEERGNRSCNWHWISWTSNALSRSLSLPGPVELTGLRQGPLSSRVKGWRPCVNCGGSSPRPLLSLI